MAPKKRRDLGDNDEVVAAGSMDPSSVAQGHAQPLGSDDLTPEPTPTPEPEDQQERDAPHNGGQSVAETARPNDDDSEPSVHTVRPLNHFEDMSTEELESELQLAMIRNALIKKKRQEKIQSSPTPASVPKDSVPQTSARHVSILKDSAIPDSDSVLHERQNERLRRAGLLPPRASEVRQFPAATPTITARQPSVPPKLSLNGIDKKISEIMNSTDSPATSILGEKPEISRAGIKITGPEKWKGDRPLQAFTDWIHSVAHYFKIHAPLSEQLKINLIGGYLTGDPLDWYWRHVAPHSMQWTATDVMIALCRHFLVDELSRQAADKFERAEQGSRDIHAFQAALLKLADQMTEYPSPIALNRRLINGMNSNLSSAIVANRGIDAELSLWEDIVQAAMDQERAQRYANTLSRGSSGHRNERGDSNTARPAKPQRSGPPPSSARPIVSNNAPKPASGLFRPPVASSSSRQPFVPGTKPTGPKPTDQCRACGAFRHWASECPKRLRANMVDVDDEFQEERHEHDHEPHDDDEEPNLIFFDTGESLEDNRPMDGEGTDSEGPSSAFNEDNEFIPRCNGISRALVEPTPIVRESNVSSAKPRFGDPVNSPTKRPPLVNPIVATVYIHGHPAKTLFDSGSTADIISGSFVDLHKISSFKLKEPSPLQLAITGSRGKINRACLAKVTHGACQQQERYFDILSIDRYDAILGTSYLKDYGAMLDISTNDIIYKIHPGKTISPATYGLKTFKAEPSASTKPVLSAYGIFNKIKKLPPRAKVSVLNASSLKTVGIGHPTDPTSGVKITNVVCTTTNPEGPSIPSAFSQHLEEHIIEGLSKEWFKKTQDLWGPRPAKLPPFREINHAIPLIDEDYRPHCRPAKCPEQFRQAYLQKIETYTKSGVWKRAAVPAAMPMMVIPKKDNRIRTVVDARQRNDNTVKDVTLFPDQDVIRRDVARAKYRSKIDQADFFEQIRIIPEDVWKTAFATPFGTFVSLVAQQGDCNVPSTAQQLMMYLFRLHIGSFVHAYLDDIFIFSDSIEEHEEHLGLVFAILRAAELYLSKDKMDLYSKSMVCLGHVIDEDGLHADEDKLSKIIAWKEMKTVKEVQRFLGLVQYLAQFFPNLTNMTGPISKLTHKGQPFEWGPLQTECLSQLQRAASKAPILKPIDPVHNKEPIFVVSDASTSGVGALYGQGSSWQTMRPAGFHSRKFNSAQMNYRTHEQELLAVLEALMKWEDQLLGRKFIIITDHRSLEYLQTQKNLSGRQARWLEYLSRFTYSIQYVPGESNVVADYLSRFWEDPTVPSQAHDFVNADARLSRDSEDEPPHLYNAAIIRNIRQRDAPGTTQPSPPNSNKTFIKPEGLTSDIGPAVQAGYSNDPFFQLIWNKPKDHKPTYTVSDGFLWFTNKDGDADSYNVCIPGVIFKGRRVTELLIDNAHKTVGHLGSLKTLAELRRYYFWPTMVKDVEAFCKSCGTCAVTKSAPKKPSGKLHPLRVPQQPWQGIALDFVGPLPVSHGYDFLLVVIDRLTSMVHLVPTVTTVTAAESARLVYDNVVRYHGLPSSIVSDQDPRWKSTFWQELHRLLSIRLLFSTAYHPQTDGSTERANRTVIQILRSIVQADQKDWKDRLTATEFAMNSQVNSSTGYSPFELLYGFNPVLSRPPGKKVSIFQGVKNYHEQIKLNIMTAHDRIIASRTRQTTQANKRRSDTAAYQLGDLVYLSTSNLKLPAGRAAKLLPRFLGPYEIVKCFSEQDAFTLELPAELTKRRIHPTFHSSLLKPHVPNDDKLFPGRDPKAFYDFGVDEEAEWNVEDILSHRWLSSKLSLLVLWSTGEQTWEPIENCNQLTALDRYLELHGVSEPSLLPQGSSSSTLVRSQ